MKYSVVSALIFEIYDDSTNTWMEVYTDASTKVLGDIILQKHAAAEHFHLIEYCYKNSNNT